MKLAALGLFVFDLATLPFGEMSRRRDWRHARSERVGARDALQFTGPGQERVTLQGAIVPGVAGSFASIETLREMADTGDVYQLADGSGRVWGGFVIVTLDDRRRSITVDGAPRWIDFSVELDRAS